MFHLIISIACLIFIWKTFQDWREKQAVRRALAPFAGLVPRNHPNYGSLLLKGVLALATIGVVLALAINGQVSH